MSPLCTGIDCNQNKSPRAVTSGQYGILSVRGEHRGAGVFPVGHFESVARGLWSVFIYGLLKIHWHPVRDGNDFLNAN